MQRSRLAAVLLGPLLFFPALVQANGPELSCDAISTLVSAPFDPYGGCASDWRIDIPGTCPTSEVAISGSSCGFDYDLRSTAEIEGNRVVLGMEGRHTSAAPSASRHGEWATASFVLSPDLGTAVPVRIEAECVPDSNDPVTDTYGVVLQESVGGEISDLGCGSGTFFLIPGITYQIEAFGEQAYDSAGEHLGSLTVTVSYAQPSVPALSPWGLVLLAVSLLGFGVYHGVRG